MRFPILLLAALAGTASAAACGGGKAPRAGAGAEVRFDTAQGYRLRMLLPEAREAARERGEELRCERPLDGMLALGPVPDSVAAYFAEVDHCTPAHDGAGYLLSFRQGSLRRIHVRLSEDWERIPADTLLGRLKARYGEPAGRDVYELENGRRESLDYWFRKGSPGALNLRCPMGSTAIDCSIEYVTGPP